MRNAVTKHSGRVTKRSILKSFVVHVYYWMPADYHIRKHCKAVKCHELGHIIDSDATITWRYVAYIPGRYYSLQKANTVYICTRCAYRIIRAQCDSPIVATRYLFAGRNGEPIVIARHTPSSKTFMAGWVAPHYNRVTSQHVTEWIYSLYPECC